MPLTLDNLGSTLWLCEPAQLQRAATRVLAHKTCPTARELVEERNRRLDEIRAQCSRVWPGVRFASTDTMHPDERAQAKPLRGIKGGVGVLPIYGVIEKRLSSELLKAGGTAVEEISAGLDSLLANKGIEAIVLDVDSPGGSASGIKTLSDKIFNARGEKKIYAVANSMAASAAYWIASAAGQVMVDPGGEVGSVGVYALHMDQSAAMEQAGIKVTMIHAGKYKVEGNPFEPLSPDTRDAWQGMVNTTYNMFTDDLKRNRGVGIEAVRNNFGQGRLVQAEEAVSRGMADRVMSFETLMSRLIGGGNPGKANAMRLKHEAAKARDS